MKNIGVKIKTNEKRVVPKKKQQKTQMFLSVKMRVGPTGNRDVMIICFPGTIMVRELILILRLHNN